mmetsp:Transcript_1234/g.1625  ORF Transcript_1234/g.1625 Transcript_1234/m.1625 type:complete len:377 (+) Transcript_1234:68-1198(+)
MSDNGGDADEEEKIKPLCFFLRSLIGLIVHCALRCLIPGLITAKMDAVGLGSASWRLVFIPIWCVLAFVGFIALTLCNCAPFVSAGMSPRVKRMAIRLIFFGATQLFVVAVCGLFFFLHLLSKKLDCEFKNDKDCVSPSPLELFTPILILYSILFLVHPLVLRDSKLFQHVVSDEMANQNNPDFNEDLVGPHRQLAEALAALNQSLVGSEDSGVLLESIASGPTRLVEYSSTLYGRATTEDDFYLCAHNDTKQPSFSEDLEQGEDSPTNSSLCYICYVAPRDAVLMECGHAGVCFSCAQKLAVRHPRSCPICRQPISTVLKLSTHDRRHKDSKVLVLANEGLAVVPSSSAQTHSTETTTEIEMMEAPQTTTTDSSP